MRPAFADRNTSPSRGSDGRVHMRVCSCASHVALMRNGQTKRGSGADASDNSVRSAGGMNLEMDHDRT